MDYESKNELERGEQGEQDGVWDREDMYWAHYTNQLTWPVCKTNWNKEVEEATGEQRETCQE